MEYQVFDISVFTRHIPGDNKPYFMLDPKTDEEADQIAELLDQGTHIHRFLNKCDSTSKHPKRVATALPVGVTPDDQAIILVIQGVIMKGEFNGGSFFVVCDPAGINTLHADLELQERKVATTIDKGIQDIIQRN